MQTKLQPKAIGWAGHVTLMEERRSEHKVFVGKPGQLGTNINIRNMREKKLVLWHEYGHAGHVHSQKESLAASL